MAIHEHDELTARATVYSLNKKRVLGHTAGAALAGDLDETQVRFDIQTKSGGVLLCTAVVHHDGERVERVSLPPHFRDYAEATGLDRLDEDFEAFLWAMAKMAFARQSTHLTCRKCGISHGAAPTVCVRYEAHDWLVAR